MNNILKNQLDQLPLETTPQPPLPAHENIRGKDYYN
jgi:hypothetical protein